jgi:plastocyanin
MRSMAGELDVGSEPSRAPIAERMRARVIPVIDFTEATLDEAVDYLRSQSGDSPINLVVLNRAWRADGEEEPRISLQLRDVPFEVALKYVSEFAGLTYRIDPHAVVIRSAWDEGLQLHTFPISNERLRQALGAEGGIGATQEWLAELGVGFPNGAAAYFEPMGANLIVRSNPAAIELIEKVLASIAEGIEVPMPREVGPPVGDPPGRLVPANRNLPPTELKLGAVPNVMQFDPAQLTVKAGASVELTFTNPGALPHNFLLLAPGSIDAVGDAANRMLSDAQNAAKLHYIPEEPEIRKLILAHTKVLQRAGSETIKFVAPAEPGTYPYICTFPGQWVLMRGQLVVEP